MNPSKQRVPPRRAEPNAGHGLLLLLCQHNVALHQEVERLRAKVASLEKDSQNSHKPPSTDGLKKNRGATTRGSSGRKQGGQKGHTGKTWTHLLTSGPIADTVAHKPQRCGACGRTLTEEDKAVPVERRQIREIPEIKPLLFEHIFYKTTCSCGHETRLAVPEWIHSGIGENLQAVLTYFTSEARLSRRILKSVLEDLFHVPLGLGTIQNRLENTSEMLKPVCDELEEELTRQGVVNIDESSFPHNRDLCWLWAFIANTFAYFTIQIFHSSKIIKKVMGEFFDGIIICDRFSAYVKYHRERACGMLQFCWAHIIRDVKALKNEVAHNSPHPFSKLMRQRIGALFKLWHTHKRGNLSRGDLIQAAEPLISEMRLFLEENTMASSKEVATFCKQLLKRWNSLFTFIRQEGVEPTNNRAERFIRPGVLIRKISYCTRSENGQLLRARLLTVSQTCRIQNRNPLEFYRSLIQAHRNSEQIPSLILQNQDVEKALPIAA